MNMFRNELSHLEIVDMSEGIVAPDQLGLFQHYARNLRRIDLSNCELDHSSLVGLPFVTDLRLARCCNVSVAFAGIQSWPKLCSLDLTSSFLSDEMLVDVLQGCRTTLRHLVLKFALTNEKSLVQAFSGELLLETLDVSHNVEVSTGVLRAIGTSCLQLRLLNVSNCDSLTRADVDLLQRYFTHPVEVIHTAILEDDSVESISNYILAIAAAQPVS